MTDPHAITRAWERHRLNLMIADLDRIVADITETVAGTSTRALMVARLPGGAEKWAVKSQGRALLVVY